MPSIASGRHGYQPEHKRIVAAMLGMVPMSVGVVLAFLPWHAVVTAQRAAPRMTVTLLPLPGSPHAEPRPVRQSQAIVAPARPMVARALQRQTPPVVSTSAATSAPASLVLVPPTIATAPFMPAPPAPPATSPAVAAAVAAPVSPPARSAGKESWEARVLARLERFKRFPPAARSRRDQGVATVRFRVDRHGFLLSSSLVEPSGSRLLDQEALATLARAEPYPPIPAGRTDTIELVVPIEFLLDRR